MLKKLAVSPRGIGFYLTDEECKFGIVKILQPFQTKVFI